MELRKKWLFTLLLLVIVVVGGVSADGHSIVDVAEGDGNFTVLVSAINEAGLLDMLDNSGPFTVFAPTDEAFGKIPAEDLDAIVADKELLRQIILYHIIQGEVSSGDVVNLTSAQTALGKYISIQADANGVVINGTSNVTAVDIGAVNGVVHVIDTVLIPPAGWGADAVSAPPESDPAPPADADEGEESTPQPADDISTTLADHIAKARFILEQMGGVLDGSSGGQKIACGEFSGYYNGLMALPTYTDEQLPPNLEGIHAKYREAVDKALDTNMSIFGLCQDGGTKATNSLNFGVARAGINDALGILIGLQELVGAGSGSNTPAPAPADPAPVEPEPADPAPADPAPADPAPSVPPGIGADLLAAMEEAKMAIETMGGILDSSSGGTKIDCGAYLGLYEKLQALPTYTDGQLPPEIEGIHANYRAAVDKTLETNEAIYSGCEGGGTKANSPLNFGAARIGINDALNILLPTLDAARPIIASLAPPPPASDPEPEPDPMPEEDMPEPAPDPEPDSDPAPATTHPVDRDGNGNITIEDFDILLLEEYTNRIDIYLETEQPLPWDAEAFYLDTTIVHYYMDALSFKDPTLDGLSLADLIRQDPTGTCFLFILIVPPAMFAPEYSGVPDEWASTYNAYRLTVDEMIASTEPFIDECLADGDGEISDSTVSQALDPLLDYTERLRQVEVTSAELLGVESFTAMGGWVSVIITAQENDMLSLTQNIALRQFNQYVSLFE